MPDTAILPTPYDFIVLLGPTASGKTRLAVQVAQAFAGEIISADSRQVYRGLDLGSGKDLAEYGPIPYHLIDIIAPGEEYNLFAFQRDCFAAIEAVRGRGRLPVLVGGTGMYLDAVLKGYRLVPVPENLELRAELETLDDAALAARLQSLRPRLHNTSDTSDRARLLRAIEIAIGESAVAATLPPPPTIHPLIFGLSWPRPELRRRITQRLQERLEQGLIEEVRQLHEVRGVAWATLEYYGLEYRYLARHLQGVLSYNDMFQQLNSAIHDFAKRQETWFRRMERQGTQIHWLDAAAEPLAQLLAIVAASGRRIRE